MYAQTTNRPTARRHALNFYFVRILEDFLAALDHLLDHESFGNVSEDLRRQIAAEAKGRATDGRFDAMHLLDIFTFGAPSLGRPLHIELFYQFLAFVGEE